MDNKLFILTKTLLKNSFGFKATGKKKVRQIIFALLIALCIVPYFTGIFYFVSSMYDSLKAINQEGVILSLGIALTSFTILFFGVFYVINVFYFADDVENLLPLPLKPSAIIGSKFIVTVIYEYITEIFIMLPLLIVYSYKSGATFMYYIYALLIFILVPVVPLSIASIIVMAIMRFTSIAKNRDRFKMVSGIIAMFTAVSFNIAIQRFASKTIDPSEVQEMFIKGQNSLIELVSRIFPGAKFAALSIVNNSNISGLINLLIFILINAVSFIIFLYIGEMWYFRGVIGISENAAKRKKVTSDELSRVSIRQSVLKAYTIKELKLLFRTPIYFMNCVLINFILPVLMVLPLITQPQNEGELDSIRVLMRSGAFEGIIVTIGFAAAIIISTFNSITPTSISREGQNFYVNKFLPVSYKTQIMAKVLSGVIISFIGVVIALISAAVFLSIPVHLIFVIAVMSLFGIVFTSFTGILIDLFHPKLNWDNEQRAVKQNLNPVFNMFLALIFGGALIWASITYSFNAVSTCGIIFLVFGIADLVLYKVISTMGVKLFGDIEV